jgi:PBP1b-binding outer membrane lipoprotein LpoB
MNRLILLFILMLLSSCAPEKNKKKETQKDIYATFNIQNPTNLDAFDYEIKLHMDKIGNNQYNILASVSDESNPSVFDYTDNSFNKTIGINIPVNNYVEEVNYFAEIPENVHSIKQSNIERTKTRNEQFVIKKSIRIINAKNFKTNGYIEINEKSKRTTDKIFFIIEQQNGVLTIYRDNC